MIAYTHNLQYSYLLFTLALSYGLHLNVTNSLNPQLLPDFLPLSRIWGQDCNLTWINFMVINQDEDNLYLKLDCRVKSKA